jgi:predicted RNA-binding Zn-ribbon protein involved in translation (DUF1610 family)
MSADEITVSGSEECPECGEEINFRIPAMLDNFLGNGVSGMVPQAVIRCKSCKKKFLVECTVNIELVE